MCSYCLSNPCRTGCPNAPDPEPVYICSLCGEGIYIGDKYFEGEDGCVCEECFEEFSPKDVLEMLGEALSIVEAEQ